MRVPYQFTKGAFESVYVVRLLPGTEVVAAVEEFAVREGITQGVILSMLGTLDQGAFRNPRPDTWLPIQREYEGADQIDTQAFERPVEIVGGAGNIFPLGESVMAHIHMLVSFDGARTMAGHLFRGRVWTQGEIVIGKIAGIDQVRRQHEGETGLPQLQLESPA